MFVLETPQLVIAVVVVAVAAEAGITNGQLQSNYQRLIVRNPILAATIRQISKSGITAQCPPKKTWKY
jgi:hypothetical protein